MALPKPPSVPSIELMSRADSASRWATGVDSLVPAAAASPPASAPWLVCVAASSAAASTLLTAGGLAVAGSTPPLLLMGSPRRLPPMPSIAALDRQGCGECWRRRWLATGLCPPGLCRLPAGWRRPALTCFRRSSSAPCRESSAECWLAGLRRAAAWHSMQVVPNPLLPSSSPCPKSAPPPCPSPGPQQRWSSLRRCCLAGPVPGPG